MVSHDSFSLSRFVACYLALLCTFLGYGYPYGYGPEFRSYLTVQSGLDSEQSPYSQKQPRVAQGCVSEQLSPRSSIIPMSDPNASSAKRNVALRRKEDHQKRRYSEACPRLILPRCHPSFPMKRMSRKIIEGQ